MIMVISIVRMILMVCMFFLGSGVWGGLKVSVGNLEKIIICGYECDGWGGCVLVLVYVLLKWYRFMVRKLVLMLVLMWCVLKLFLLVVFIVKNSGSRCLLVGCVCLVNGVCWW